jgi:hypothetical protein
MMLVVLSTGQDFVALPDKGGLSELAQVWVLPHHVSLEQCWRLVWWQANEFLQQADMEYIVDSGT